MADPAQKQRARRQDVAHAALRVIAHEGLKRASLRAVAAELGCTMGVITHYFPSKDALLGLVLETVAVQIREAFDTAPMRSLGDLSALLGQILPIDRSRRELWKAWLSFAVAAADSPRLAADHALEYRALTAKTAQALEALRAQGRLKPGIDIDAEAEALICLLDGVGLHGALMPERMPPARQRAIMTTHVIGLAAPEIHDRG